MTIRTLNRTILSLLATSVLCLGAFASPQGQVDSITLKPVGKIKIPKSVHFSTKDFKPQISPIRKPHGKPSENPIPPLFRDSGTPNDLPVGELIPETRGLKPKISFPGPGFTGYAPPDCDMAVGPGNVIAVVNTAMGIYSRTGTLLFQTNLDGNGFFSGIGVSGEVISDPRVVYDAVSQRWFVHIIEVGGLFDTNATKGSFQLIAVSDTSDPMGGWQKYRISTKITVSGNELWLDYPGVGVNRDGYVVTGNMFGWTNGFAVAIFTIPKAALINGTATTANVFVDPDSGGTIMPSRTYDSTTGTMYCASNYNTSTIKLYAIDGLAGNTPSVTSTKVTVPTFGYPRVDAAANGGFTMDGFGDGRTFTSAYRNGKIYTAHNISTNNGAKIGSRWYEFATNGWPVSGNPTLRQSGNISVAGGDAHMPAISATNQGAVSVVYTLNSPSTNPSLVYSARKPTDALGTLGQPVTLVQSGAAGNNNANFGRWGDYFSVQLDPTDAFQFWGFGETISSAGTWQTTVCNWKIFDPALLQPMTLVSLGIFRDQTDFQGTYVSGTINDAATANSAYYTVASKLVANLGQTAALDVTMHVPTALDNTDFVTVTMTATTPTGITGQLFLYPAGSSSGGTLVASAPLGTAKSVSFTFQASQLANYVDSNGNLRAVFRAVKPIRLGKTAFTAKFDLTGGTSYPINPP